MDRKQAQSYLQDSLSYIRQRIVGQQQTITQMMACFLARGHLLMTGAPGLGKTLMVKIFSEYLGASFGRIQYTPDLLPSDITGSEILQVSNDQKRHFEFVKGPIFSQLVLADEINRASPRTQAAMLEAMQEKSVTYNGKHHPLPSPFMVCATQNPLESEGTYPLPEAQLDRFLIHALLSYPSESQELDILKIYHTSEPTFDGVSPKILTPKDFDTLFHHAETTSVKAEIFQLVNSLTRATRHLPEDLPAAEGLIEPVRFGAGPRGGLGLIVAAKSYAFMQGDDEVRWSHIKKLACPVLRHRISLHPRYHRQIGGTDNFIEAHIQHLEDTHNLKQNR